MDLCDECNNCTKFEFYTEKIVRDSIFCDFTLCPHCDVTSDAICINRNLE